MERFAELHDGHRNRLRDRVMDEGLDAMQPHEILEYLLYLALPRQDVNTLAHALLDHFSSVREVLRAELPELMRVEGIGRNTARWIALVGEAVLGAVALENKEIEIQFNCLRDTLKNVKRISQECPAPCSVQICINLSKEMIYRRVIAPSRAWGEPATLRDAMADVLATGAKGVILLQFVGKLLPEADDYDLEHIQKYAFSLHAAGCTLLDMILVSYGGVTSLRQEAKIPDYQFGEGVEYLREDYARCLQEAGDLNRIAYPYLPVENE